MLMADTKRHPDNVDIKEQYQRVAYLCRQLIFNFEVERETTLLDGGNMKKFYKHVKKKMTCKTQIPTLLNDDGTLFDVDDDAALFNDYFCSTCVEDDGVRPKLPDSVPVLIEFDSIELINNNNNVFLLRRLHRDSKVRDVAIL